MKAVVVQIEGNVAAVLSDDGCVKKIRNRNYTKGQVIELKEKNSWNRGKMAVCASIALVLFAGTGTGIWAYASPYSYVSLDVNPSVAYTLNRFDKVLTVTAVNDDGKKIVEELELEKLNHKSIEEAIDQTIKHFIDRGFFDEDEVSIVIAAAGKDKEKSEQLANKLKDQVKADRTKGNVEVMAVGRERVEEARKLNTTPGKLNLVQKLQESAQDPDDIDIEEWLEKPVQEIMSATKENRTATGPKTEAKQEAKESRTETKQEAKEFKAEAKQETKESKAEVKQETKESKAETKQEAKESKTEVRQEAKESRESKAEAKQEAKESKTETKQEAKESKAEAKQEVKESRSETKQEAKAPAAETKQEVKESKTAEKQQEKESRQADQKEKKSDKK